MSHMTVGTSESAYYARLGAALRAMRAAADLSRDEVAYDLRVSVETVARWERGDNAIKAFTSPPWPNSAASCRTPTSTFSTRPS